MLAEMAELAFRNLQSGSKVIGKETLIKQVIFSRLAINAQVSKIAYCDGNFMVQRRRMTV